MARRRCRPRTATRTDTTSPPRQEHAHDQHVATIASALGGPPGRALARVARSTESTDTGTRSRSRKTTSRRVARRRRATRTWVRSPWGNKAGRLAPLRLDGEEHERGQGRAGDEGDAENRAERPGRCRRPPATATARPRSGPTRVQPITWIRGDGPRKLDGPATDVVARRARRRRPRLQGTRPPVAKPEAQR